MKKKNKKKVIKPTEARVLQALARTPRPLTINEVASKSGTAWKTADTHLKKWKRKKLVIKNPGNKRKRVLKNQWTIDRRRLSMIIKKRKRR